MRRLLLLFFFVSASCVSTPAPRPPFAVTMATDSAPAALPAEAPRHAAQIRFGLIGAPRDVNVWELFDQSGASYADYALRSEYWARLYSLAPPEFSFQPRAAQGFPAELIQEGEFYSALVKIRPDLKWTDSSPFTAEDIAFTVNAALAFELGLDWRAYYPRKYIERAEALDKTTVKFVFKQKPDVSAWQYGALQGPLVQKKFWESKISAAQNLLPEDSLTTEIQNARAALETIQWDINVMYSKLNEIYANGQGDRALEITLARRQRELDHAQYGLDKLLEKYEDEMQTARQSLYALDDANEPTLGAWIFESKTSSQWINAANPNFPFEQPHFDRAVYSIFENEKDALAAFEKNEIDFILSPNGISRAASGARNTLTNRARFLVFNPSRKEFSDPAFRLALSCMINREDLARDILKNNAAPLFSFALSPQWRNPNIADSCANLDKSERIEYAVKILKGAGYSWRRQPAKNNVGQGFISPNGEAFPKIVLSAPSQEADALRYAAAIYIAEKIHDLGIPFSVREMSANDVVYAVFSSQKYDAALIGWQLSEYPGYVCEWFGGENPYLLNEETFSPQCGALAAESNLESAQNIFRQLESDLADELPLIPLFRLTRLEAYQNLAYPALYGLDGWSSLYGAPSYAMPSP